MKIVLITFSTIFLFCSNPFANRACIFQQKSFQQSLPDYNVAVQFINDYVTYMNDTESEASLILWTSERSDVTAVFKNAIEEMLDEAEADAPSYGLGFDPILDAQDHPDKFELESTKSEYLVVKGMDWSSFKLTMRLKFENGKWRVDGAGIINIPIDKRIKR